MGKVKKRQNPTTIVTRITIVSRYGADVPSTHETVFINPEEGESSNEARERIRRLAEARVAELIEEHNAKEGDFYIIEKGIKTTSPNLWKNVGKRVMKNNSGPTMPKSKRKD